MGDKGGKKDKNKAVKQKQDELEKKKEQQKNKLPAKKPVQHWNFSQRGSEITWKDRSANVDLVWQTTNRNTR